MTQPTTRSEAQALVLDALCEVAPDIDPETVDRDAHLQEDLELDSMDFLNFVAALSEETGLPIPEGDYARLDTVAHCTRYIVAQGGPA